MAARATIKSSGPGLDSIEKAVAQLVKTRLLVGIPGDSAPREPEPGQKGTPPPNAVIGYIQEHGDDELHIPPRPFLVPGVRDAMPAIVKGLHKAAVSALSGKPEGIAAGFEAAGLKAVASVQARMNAGPFAPLAVSTIKARARRRYPDTGKLHNTKASREARSFLKLKAEGTPEWALHGAGLAQPLIDTRSLYRSVVYIVKDSK